MGMENIQPRHAQAFCIRHGLFSGGKRTTFDLISKSLGVSRERVRQMNAKSIMRIAFLTRVSASRYIAKPSEHELSRMKLIEALAAKRIFKARERSNSGPAKNWIQISMRQL
jgi:hypothetical protein